MRLLTKIGTSLKKYIMSATLILSGITMAQIQHVQRPEDSRTPEQYQADCKAGISLSSCSIQPVSKDCEIGKHWSLDDTGHAHCVLNDMNCPDGTRLEHDNLGNPSCQVIVCPPEFELRNNQCIPVEKHQSPVHSTWSGRVTASTTCGRMSGNGSITSCKANLGSTITNWLQSNVSLLASQNSEVQAAIQFFYANCSTILRSYADEKNVSFTSSSGTVKGSCRTIYEPDLMRPKPGQIKYDSISNWILNLTNIPN